MLPRTRRCLVSHRDWHPFLQCPNAIRNDSVGGPITTANDIACSNAGDFHWMVLKKRAPVRADRYFRGRFARAVRIVAAEGILLTIATLAFPVFIAFVCGYQNCRAWLL